MFKTSKLRHLLTLGRSANTAILMYHRINDTAADPWETSVSPAHFQEHLSVLQRDYQVHPLSALAEIRLQADKERKVLITFDDGYLDNYTTAMPLLEQYGWPATFFIPTQNVVEGQLFWWEILDHLFWSRRATAAQWAPILQAEYLPDTSYGSFDHSSQGLEDHWSANTMKPPTAYCRFYLELSAYIKLQACDRQQAIARRLAALDPDGVPEAMEKCKKMSNLELNTLSNHGFQLGGHSVHHPALGLQDVQVQRREIWETKAPLAALTGEPVTTFAYPHGHYTETTKAIVKEAGFSTACTTAGGVIFPDTDMLSLPRIWVKDWPAATFKRRLDQYFAGKKSV